MLLAVRFLNVVSLDHITRVSQVSGKLGLIGGMSLFSEPGAAVVAWLAVQCGGGAGLSRGIMLFLCCLTSSALLRISPLFLLLFSFLPQGYLLMGNITPFFLGSLLTIGFVMRSEKQGKNVLTGIRLLGVIISVLFHWSMILVFASYVCWYFLLSRRGWVFGAIIMLAILMLLASIGGVDLSAIESRAATYEDVAGSSFHSILAIVSYVVFFLIVYASYWPLGRRTYYKFLPFVAIVLVVEVFISSKAGSRLAFFLDSLVFVVAARIAGALLKIGLRNCFRRDAFVNDPLSQELVDTRN